jgi:squalene-hopene/tetraprenyl-beta-curcumene cyclase
MNDTATESQNLTPKMTTPPAAAFSESLDAGIEKSRHFLLACQDEKGFWVGELESNVTITAEVIFFMHFTDTVDLDRQAKIAKYLIDKQRQDGSWPLYFGGPCDINSTVESYMALKLAGFSADHPQMVKAREAIHENGGIQKTRVFTKIFLAMFGQISWEMTPAVPVEIVLFSPKLFFNVYEISSWSRGTVVPLSIVIAHQPVHTPDAGRDVQELFTENDHDLNFHPSGHLFSSWRNFFIYLDGFIKFIGKSPWKPFRKKALKVAERWVLDHQEKEGDWAGIQPAMLNSLLALHYLGYAKDNPAWTKGLESVDRFLIEQDGQLCMQACVSPLWDSAIACNALLESGLPPDHPALVKSAEWILNEQVTEYGDWKFKNPNTPPGGWAFEFFNEGYPDTDDTAEILMALNRIEVPDHRWKFKEIQRALTWLLGMQSSNGGWGAFDRDNDNEVLNEVPFADHKALLDPPTVDVSSRILWALGRLGFSREHPKGRQTLEFVKSRQEADGCWFGRWGVNYIYGTFLALNGLSSMGENPDSPMFRRPVEWYDKHQNEDGGWGETCESYDKPELRGQGASTASQTAWAILGLLAAGEVKNPAVQKGVDYLLSQQNEEGSWWEDEFTGTGFPVHFFIKYHMYQDFFPLMALACYRNALEENEQK